MLGTRTIEEVRNRKEALLLESSLNRLKLQAELQNLRLSINPVSGLAGKTRGVLPWLMLLAPVIGFFVSRRARQRGSITSRLGSLFKLAVPLYRVWHRFSQ